MFFIPEKIMNVFHINVLFAISIMLQAQYICSCSLTDKPHCVAMLVADRGAFC